MHENWKTYKLKEVAKLSTGFAFKSKNYKNFGELKYSAAIDYFFTKSFGLNVRYDEDLGFNFGISLYI